MILYLVYRSRENKFITTQRSQLSTNKQILIVQKHHKLNKTNDKTINLYTKSSMSTSKYSKRIKKGESQAISSQYYRESKSFNNSREINQDTSPLIVKKKPNHNIKYVQEVSIRYLKPPTPPPPGDIIIKEIEAEAFPAAPPLILRQQPPRPFTPDPFIIRELPPRPPPFKTTQVIKQDIILPFSLLPIIKLMHI